MQIQHNVRRRLCPKHHDGSAISKLKACSLRLSTVYPLGTASALGGGLSVIARKRSMLIGFLPCRFMVIRKTPFNIKACQLIIMFSI